MTAYENANKADFSTSVSYPATHGHVDVVGVPYQAETYGVHPRDLNFDSKGHKLRRTAQEVKEELAPRNHHPSQAERPHKVPGPDMTKHTSLPPGPNQSSHSSPQSTSHKYSQHGTKDRQPPSFNGPG